MFFAILVIIPIFPPKTLMWQKTTYVEVPTWKMTFTCHKINIFFNLKNNLNICTKKKKSIKKKNISTCSSQSLSSTTSFFIIILINLITSSSTSFIVQPHITQHNIRKHIPSQEIKPNKSLFSLIISILFCYTLVWTPVPSTD